MRTHKKKHRMKENRNQTVNLKCFCCLLFSSLFSIPAKCDGKKKQIKMCVCSFSSVCKLFTRKYSKMPLATMCRRNVRKVSFDYIIFAPNTRPHTHSTRAPTHAQTPSGPNLSAKEWSDKVSSLSIIALWTIAFSHLCRGALVPRHQAQFTRQIVIKLIQFQTIIISASHTVLKRLCAYNFHFEHFLVPALFYSLARSLSLSLFLFLLQNSSAPWNLCTDVVSRCWIMTLWFQNIVLLFVCDQRNQHRCTKHISNLIWRKRKTPYPS